MDNVYQLLAFWAKRGRKSIRRRKPQSMHLPIIVYSSLSAFFFGKLAAPEFNALTYLAHVKSTQLSYKIMPHKLFGKHISWFSFYPTGGMWTRCDLSSNFPSMDSHLSAFLEAMFTIFFIVHGWSKFPFFFSLNKDRI